MEEKPTDGTCVFCGGEVVEKITNVFDSMFGPPIFGPASRNQYIEVSEGFHCKRCGLKYEFVPQDKS